MPACVGVRLQRRGCPADTAAAPARL